MFAILGKRLKMYLSSMIFRGCYSDFCVWLSRLTYMKYKINILEILLNYKHIYSFDYNSYAESFAEYR